MTSSLRHDVARALRDIPDFPKPGILFKDITPVLLDPALFRRVVRWMGEDWGPVDKVVGMESRGFLFGAGLVQHLDAGFVPARKRGKLPWETRAVDYALEYGTATLEMHVDAIRPGERVLVVDDLLATGGTAAAALALVRALGGEVVGCAFLVELTDLAGRERLDCEVRSLVAL